MTNPLCDAGCLGFPTYIYPSAPTFPVFCKSGDLVIAPPTTNVASRQAGSEASGATLVSGMTVPLAYISPAFSNPFAHDINVTVDHEFALRAFLCDEDVWEIYGDLNCTGTGVTLASGGTSGGFLQERNDGSAIVNSNQIKERYLSYSATMLYTVPASTAFTIGMHVRLEATTIRGGFRGVVGGYTAMTVNMHPKYI